MAKSMALALLLLTPAAAKADGLTLMMVDLEGCPFCLMWEREIEHIYPQTAEGRCAPLMKVDLHDPLPADIALQTPVHVTPTFVMLRDGREVARIEGYSGEDFFWFQLETAIEASGVDCAA